MRHVGTRLPIDSVQPGDLLFFNTLGRPWSHVAIAIGDGQFVHAPARGGRVRVERLTDPYWTQRFNGARRIRGPAPTVEPLPPPPASIFDDPRVTP
jgi:cell wall-associated NlpC family hydrolase